MRGYGLPRNDDVQNPDKGDIRLYALSGHGYRFHNANKKRLNRQVWKHVERSKAKAEIFAEIKALN